MITFVNIFRHGLCCFGISFIILIAPIVAGAESSPKTSSSDYTKFDLRLGKTAIFHIHVTKIFFKREKNVFVKKAYEDGPAEVKIDGLSLNVHFSITNPDNKIYEVPIPDYFTITSADPDFYSLPGVFRQRWKNTIGTSDGIAYKNGKKSTIHKIKIVYGENRVRFDPNESIKFEISFPFITDNIETLTLRGLDDYGSRDLKTLVIDVKKQEIVGWDSYRIY